MTAIQKQCLLKYLGYYSGEVDGIWGNASQIATAELQKASGLTADGVFGEKTEEIAKSAVFYGKFRTEDEPAGDFWDGVKYFDRSEFACKCGGKYCNGFPVEPNELLITVADRVREHFGAPMRVSSGVRCKQHNANVGGASGSRHKSGKAMDFCVTGKSANEVLAYVKKQPEIRYCYAIDGSYVHMDVN